MSRSREASGREALELVSRLLQRVRLAEPTAGVWEAADFQWWWRKPRRSDAIPQRFWLDEAGPIAATMVTDWGEAWAFDPITLPDVRPPFRREVWEAGLEAIAGLSGDLQSSPMETRVRDGDVDLESFLTAHGFVRTGTTDGTSWMGASGPRQAGAPPSGFQIVDRGSRPDGTHWMAGRNGPAVEARLRETTLYDLGLDLSVRAPSGEAVGYALFWFDPVTLVGMLEPMRVEDAWQRRGLARALISDGIGRLVRRGATRVKVSFESDVARALYLGAGFEPESTTTTLVRPGRQPA